MKPFDINKAREGTPVVTRCGLRVHIDNFEYPYLDKDLKEILLMVGTTENGDLQLWDQQGKLHYDGKEDPLDLFLE